MSQVMTAFGDGVVVAKRNLIKIKRVPDILVFVLLSPIMFVLLFAFVFAGAMDVPGDYKEFLIAGILAQTVVFGSTFTGVGLADDMQKGIIDRFRSLPDVALGRGGGADRERHRLQPDLDHHHVADRAPRRMGDHNLRCGSGAGIRAAAPLRLFLLLGHGLCGAAGTERRGDQQRLVHGDLPPHLRVQRLRPARNASPCSGRPSPSGTRSRRSPRQPGNCSATSPRVPPSPRPGHCRTRSSTP